MKKLFWFFNFLVLAIVLPSCGSQPPSQTATITNSKQVSLSNSKEVKSKIYSQYKQWHGVKYQMGGLSKKGVDCSGLVYLTYRENLGIEIPRSTALQSKTGKEVKRSELRAGDLVFFKTSYKVRHVGIYIEDGKFFHASTSKGVMISNLNDYYWKDKYWHSRRMTS